VGGDDGEVAGQVKVLVEKGLRFFFPHSRGTPCARGRQCKTSKKDKKRVRGERRRRKKTDSTQINLNKRSLVKPRSTSNQSSKLCIVLQYPSRKAALKDSRKAGEARRYGLATISRLLKIIGLFCRI